MSNLSETMEAARQAWLRTQTRRIQRGLCIACGQSVAECWCGHGDQKPYEPSAEGEDDE